MQVISYVAILVRSQWCSAMATRVMPILLYSINICGSNLEITICDLLKIDSLRTSLAHETRSQTQLAGVNALFAAV